MTLSKFFKFSVFATMALSFVACENDDDDDDVPNDVNEEEVITDMVLTFTNIDDQSVQAFAFSDPDGPGGTDPTIDDIILSDSSTYAVSVELLDASDPSDVEDITIEIQEEAEVHQLFYIPQNGADNSVTVTYEIAEVDDDGNPIGLSTVWDTFQPTSGNEAFRIVLRHNLDKNAQGIDINNFAAAGGETDIDVVFNLTVTD